MQDLENYTDELFRKAAESYPLKTSGSHWDKIAHRLLLKNKLKNARRFKVLGLLVILSIAISSGLLLVRSHKNETIRSAKEVEKANSSKNHKSNEIIPVKEFKKTVEDETFKKGAIHDIPGSNSAIAVPKEKGGNEKKYIAKGSKKSNSDRLDELALRSPGTTEVKRQLDREFLEYLIGNNAEGPNRGIELQIKEKLDNSRLPDNVINDSIQKATSNTVPLTENQNRFYLGFVAGPTFNEVKHQGADKPGFDFGLVTGYKLSKMVAFETGLLYTKKYYYSDGKYFSTSSMPPGMDLMSFEGKSTVFQIPLKFQLNFVNKKTSSSVFSSVGVSSYIMTKEINDYVIMMNGTEQHMQSSYDKSSRYFAAAFDFSLGYDHKIGKSIRFRIEPHIQIPLKGIGVGTIPVSSAGLRLGVLKSLH